MEKMEASPSMAKMGWSWVDAKVVVEHIVNLLEKDGPLYAATARNLLQMVEFITARNLGGIIMSLTEAKDDFTKIIADIKSEFGLN